MCSDSITLFSFYGFELLPFDEVLPPFTFLNVYLDMGGLLFPDLNA